MHDRSRDRKSEGRACHAKEQFESRKEGSELCGTFHHQRVHVRNRNCRDIPAEGFGFPDNTAGGHHSYDNGAKKAFPFGALSERLSSLFSLRLLTFAAKELQAS